MGHDCALLVKNILEVGEKKTLQQSFSQNKFPHRLSQRNLITLNEDREFKNQDVLLD